jgi:hypothetical protein
MAEAKIKMASAALRHPIRVRLLEVMALFGEISATMFIHEGWGRDIEALDGHSHQRQVSDVARHLRELEKADCVYETRKEPRRGRWEVFYRSNSVAYFSDDEWAAVPYAERKAISRVMSQGFIAQMEGAQLADTFDSRRDRWLLWEPYELDEQGWTELSAATADYYSKVRQIGEASKDRLAAAGDDARPIPTTVGVASFESPELSQPQKPALPDDQSDGT